LDVPLSLLLCRVLNPTFIPPGVSTAILLIRLWFSQGLEHINVYVRTTPSRVMSMNRSALEGSFGMRQFGGITFGPQTTENIQAVRTLCRQGASSPVLRLYLSFSFYSLVFCLQCGLWAFLPFEVPCSQLGSCTSSRASRGHHFFPSRGLRSFEVTFFSYQSEESLLEGPPHKSRLSTRGICH